MNKTRCSYFMMIRTIGFIIDQKHTKAPLGASITVQVEEANIEKKNYIKFKMVN